jgi:hypothetical protein
LIILIILVESTSHEVLHYAVFFTLLSPHLFGPNILLSTLFSNTLDLCYCTFASCHTSLFYFHFLGSVFRGLLMFETLYSVFNTCHFIKSLKHYIFRSELGIPKC